jgi:hypothetical protein
MWTKHVGHTAKHYVYRGTAGVLRRVAIQVKDRIVAWLGDVHVIVAGCDENVTGEKFLTTLALLNRHF